MSSGAINRKGKWDTTRGQLAKKLGVVTTSTTADCYASLGTLTEEELVQFLASNTPQDALDLAWLKRFAPVVSASGVGSL